MVPAVCCIADPRDGGASPGLPNVRMKGPSPHKRPLLPTRMNSYGSRFTSTRTEELHELRQIFDSAADPGTEPDTPTKPKLLPRLGSRRSLQKIKSVQALIKRKLSRDFSRPKSNNRLKEVKKSGGESSHESGTIVKAAHNGPNTELKITKEDLRKDLLSTKRPEEGGYDSDAEVLEDIAQKLAKRTPSKRASIHSIEWVSSPSQSKGTPASQRKARCCERGREKHCYHIYRLNTSQKSSSPTKFMHYASSPNLQELKPDKTRGRKLKRSHSTTTLELPTAPALEPIRLPSIASLDALPTSLFTHESLRLPQFPLPPGHSKSDEDQQVPLTAESQKLVIEKLAGIENLIKSSQSPQRTRDKVDSPMNLSDDGEEHAVDEVLAEDNKSERPDENETLRASVHLCDMQISHRLRSGSILSSAPSDQTPTGPQPIRIMSGDSYLSKLPDIGHCNRHNRQTSSAGFASAKVPQDWGNVISQPSTSAEPQVQRDEASSVYSSRPHSPPESLAEPLAHLALTFTHDECTPKTSDIPRIRLDGAGTHISTLTEPRISPVQQAASVETLNALPEHAGFGGSISTARSEQDFPELSRVYANSSCVQASASSHTVPKSQLLKPPSSSPTKGHSFDGSGSRKSRFKEEFSPPPSKKRFSGPKAFKKLWHSRGALRSKSAQFPALLDGPADSASPAKKRTSKSMMSLKVEQDELQGHHHDASPMWERALKNYQEERAAMFLTPNKAMVREASPFRERSSSVSRSLSDKSSAAPSGISPGGFKPHGQTPSPSQKPAGGYFPEPAEGSPSPGQKPTAAPDIRDEAGITQSMKEDWDQKRDSTEAVGAWGRFPSHTRTQRTGSAGEVDSVTPHDFALENAIRFAMGHEAELSSPDPRFKKKKRVGTALSKSSSMTFGKKFLKNYVGMFKSQSTEFRRHGRGHRTSVAAGGLVDYPELELLPDVWKRVSTGQRNPRIAGEAVVDEGEDSFVTAAEGSPEKSSPNKGKGKEKEKVKEPLRRSRSRMNLDGTVDESSFLLPMTAHPLHDMHTLYSAMHNRLQSKEEEQQEADRARIWQRYYASCVEYPRTSTDFTDEAQHALARELKEWACQSRELLSRGSIESRRRAGSKSDGSGDGSGSGSTRGMKRSDTTLSLPARLLKQDIDYVPEAEGDLNSFMTEGMKRDADRAADMCKELQGEQKAKALRYFENVRDGFLEFETTGRRERRVRLMREYGFGEEAVETARLGSNREILRVVGEVGLPSVLRI